MQQKTRRENNFKESCSSLESKSQVPVNLNGRPDWTDKAAAAAAAFCSPIAPLTLFHQANGDVLKLFSSTV
jgi:hypothetical protein